MHKFIHPNSSPGLEGMVSLKAIVQQSKESLLHELAGTAARRLSKLSAADALKQVEELTKSKLELPLLGKIKALADQRHRIVHEGDAAIVDAVRIRKEFETLELLAEEFAQRLEQNGVKVRRDHFKA